MLAPGFVFSQASLQDYVDCPRRFELRYVLGVAWPAPLAEGGLEAERYMERGANFHRLVHQYLLGIPEDALADSIDDLELFAWWGAYLRHSPQLEGVVTPEAVLSAPVAGHRLLAKLDVVAAMPGKQLTIVDWKTNRHLPRRAWLEGRLQTRVYRFLLARAGQHHNGGAPVDPALIEMIYWFAQFPAQPERFRYDSTMCAQDDGFLSALIKEIVMAAGEGSMPLAEERRTCGFCRFKTLCERLVTSEELEELDADGLSFDFDVDLEQAAEVDF